MSELEVQVIQLLSELDDRAKEELLKYGNYLKYSGNGEDFVPLSGDRSEFCNAAISKNRGISDWEIDYRVEKAIKEKVCQQREMMVGGSLKCVKLGKWQGKEIEWLIIDTQEDKQLLLSKYIIGEMRLDKSKQYKHWEESSSRRVLNSDFFNSIYKYSKDAGEDDFISVDGDKVFLLNSEEFNKYLVDKNEKLGVNGISDELSSLVYCNWMLRSDDEEAKVTFVDECGYVCYGSSERVYGVRPAMWVKL